MTEIKAPRPVSFASLVQLFYRVFGVPACVESLYDCLLPGHYAVVSGFCAASLGQNADSSELKRHYS
jgi:hypothetical protein